MRKRLTESVIDANNCERNNNKRKYVIWKTIEANQPVKKTLIDDEKQQYYKRDTLIND